MSQEFDNLDINFYFKPISENRLAVDYEKINNSPFPVVAILCERKLRLKTFGAKEFTFNQFLKTGAKTLWLRNSKTEVEMECEQWLDDVPENMFDLERRGNSDYPWFCLQDKKYCRLMWINKPEILRGSRVGMQYIIWDEFTSDKNLNFSIVKNLDNIISSTETQNVTNQKLILLSNFRTIHHPLFVAWGISHLEKEVTKIYDDYGKPLILILRPNITPEQREIIENENKNNLGYRLAKLSGSVNHIYFNESSVDTDNFIYQYFNFDIETKFKILQKMTLPKSYLKLSMTLFHENEFLNIYEINCVNPLGTQFHAVNISLLANIFRKEKIDIKLADLFYQTKNKPEIFVVAKKQIKENYITLLTSQVERMRHLLMNNEISFENIASKNLFYNIIKT